MEAVHIPETSDCFNDTIRRYILEGSQLHKSIFFSFKLSNLLQLRSEIQKQEIIRDKGSKGTDFSGDYTGEVSKKLRFYACSRFIYYLNRKSEKNGRDENPACYIKRKKIIELMLLGAVRKMFEIVCSSALYLLNFTLERKYTGIRAFIHICPVYIK